MGSKHGGRGGGGIGGSGPRFLRTKMLNLLLFFNAHMALEREGTTQPTEESCCASSIIGQRLIVSFLKLITAFAALGFSHPGVLSFRQRSQEPPAPPPFFPSARLADLSIIPAMGAAGSTRAWIYEVGVIARSPSLALLLLCLPARVCISARH